MRFYLLDNVGCQLIGHYARSLKFGVPEIGRPKKLHPDKIPMPRPQVVKRHASRCLSCKAGISLYRNQIAAKQQPKSAG